MTNEIAIPTERGEVRALFDPPGHDCHAAAILVGGADGGFEGPAESLYPALAADLASMGCGTLRLDFRIHKFPNDVDEGVYDVRAGLAYVERLGVTRVALVGHSFGGAVVIDAAVGSPQVACVATLATQTAGAQRVGLLAPTPLLLIHGLNDIRLSPECSRLLHRLAGEPKRIVLLEGATHSLRQRREDVRRLLLHWFAHLLRPAAPAP
ncbi:MAG: alpha/beta hydrolase [Chloroflexi bacterium]|nr:alpha/beta hydrolase [Chloroflexota bacterium]